MFEGRKSPFEGGSRGMLSKRFGLSKDYFLNRRHDEAIFFGHCSTAGEGRDIGHTRVALVRGEKIAAVA